MPRQCSVCNAAEIRIQIESCIRAGMPQAEIAREFGFSPDSLARHVRNHMNQPKVSTSMASRLESLWQRADSLYEQAAQTNDTRRAVDCLTKLTAIYESMSKLQTQATDFESLSMPDKIARIKADRELYRGLFDDIRDAYDALPKSPILCSACSLPILSN